MCQSPLLNEQPWHLQDPPSLITVNAAKRLHQVTGSYLHCICSGCWLSGEGPGSWVGLCEQRVSPSARGGWSAWPWERVHPARERRMTRLSGQLSCGVPSGPQQTWLACLETFGLAVSWCGHKGYLNLTFSSKFVGSFLSACSFVNKFQACPPYFFSIMLYSKQFLMLQEIIIWAIELPEGISGCWVSKAEERQKNSGLISRLLEASAVLFLGNPGFFFFPPLVWLTFPFSLFSEVWPRQSAARVSECQQQVSLSCGSVWGVVLAAEPSSCPACLCSSKEKCVSGAWMLQFMCVFFSGVAGLQSLGRPGSNSAWVDSSRWQQWVGPGPPCGLPLSGTSCVDQQPLLPLCVLRLTYISFLLCTLPGSHKGTSCCP